MAFNYGQPTAVLYTPFHTSFPGETLYSPNGAFTDYVARISRRCEHCFGKTETDEIIRVGANECLCVRASTKRCASVFTF